MEGRSGALGALLLADPAAKVAAVRALQGNQSGVMVAFQPPNLKFVPLSEAINKVRTVPDDSVFVQIARSLGIALGEGEVKS